MIVYSLKKSQNGSLNFEKATIFNDYSNFVNIFLSKSITEWPKYIYINNLLINLVDDK